MSNSLYDSLPRDPEQAFLTLEAKFRDDCETAVNRAHENARVEVFYMHYIGRVLAAISELELAGQFRDTVPNIEDVDYNTYLNFSKDVEHYRTKLEIRHSRRAQGFSVCFDLAAKEKVRHHIGQLRGIFDTLELDQKKKDALLTKLRDLESEVDRERTRFDAFAALAIEAAGVIGEVIEKSKVLKLLNAIAGAIHGAKEEEEAKQLPAPQRPKQIEPPRAPTKAPPRDFSANPDDEIPF